MEEGKEVLKQLVEIVREICGYPECGNTSKTCYSNLVRRVKLLTPLLEELNDGGGGGAFMDPQQQFGALPSFKVALLSAKHLLQSVNQGSKLYQALQQEKVAKQFQEVTKQIEKALHQISYHKLDISEEVKEQTELVHAQFKRAKERIDLPDSELEMDLLMAKKDKQPNLTILKRISEKLQLRTIADLKKEAIALHELVISNGGELGDCLEEMSSLLKKLNDSALSRKLEAETSEKETAFMNHKSPVIPDDFRCPISLELMRDPVIVSTGQTYERSCIKKWLDAGHKTCPKTQQTLSHAALTPNYILKSLISQWCEINGIELTRKQGSCRDQRSSSSMLDCDRAAITSLLQKLMNRNSEEQRAATGELRLLAKRNADNRVCIAEAGAIPLLVELLSSPDPRTQEHAVTALLNLSIHEPNKGNIVNAGAIPDIVDVLKNGSMEARENAAATLFSLSVVDDNKVAIGAAGAIPALIDLLCLGSSRGKKDAATAIFNLLIYQGNKVRAVRAGIVDPLMRLLNDASGGMMDETLAILAILASHQEGKVSIGRAKPIPVLIDLIKTGSPRNRENAAAVLWSLCTGDVQHIKATKELWGQEALKELLEHGTGRAKRKAENILELLERTDDVIDEITNSQL